MPLTDYEIFEQSPGGKRELRQEELLIDAQEEIAWAMGRASVSRADLAKMLGKSRSFVTQILSSGRNLTLRTLADIATALGSRVTLRIVSEDAPITASAEVTGNQYEMFESSRLPPSTPTPLVCLGSSAAEEA